LVATRRAVYEKLQQVIGRPQKPDCLLRQFKPPGSGPLPIEVKEFALMQSQTWMQYPG